MRFLVDAPLPRRLCDWFAAAGHDVKHTLDLPLQNKTPDSDILELAEREDRIVVTKVDDFAQSFHHRDTPPACFWSRPAT